LAPGAADNSIADNSIAGNSMNAAP
jgi:hypothetical protein